jgi:glycerol-3-phosphate acyltransferase PlsY
MTATFLILVAFFLGSLPFSLWLGRLVLAKDIRDVGDGNPGAANVTRAGGYTWGAVAMLLDFFKGALPVGYAMFALELRGWPMVAVALGPVLGHVFSPFLGGRGGKGLATTVGIWAGMTLGEAALILGIFFALWELVLDVDGWAVMLGLGGLLAYLLLYDSSTLLLAVWVGNAPLLAWTHRADLRQRPHLRAWLRP